MTSLDNSGDLFHYLKNLPAGGLAEELGASVFSQILAGVGYAHNQHICHRDLKLENILLPKYVRCDGLALRSSLRSS